MEQQYQWSTGMSLVLRALILADTDHWLNPPGDVPVSFRQETTSATRVLQSVGFAHHDRFCKNHRSKHVDLQRNTVEYW